MALTVFYFSATNVVNLICTEHIILFTWELCNLEKQFHSKMGGSYNKKYNNNVLVSGQ